MFNWPEAGQESKPVYIAGAKTSGGSENMDGFLGADLSTVTAATINDLRKAVAVQQYYEALARGGSRYEEGRKPFFSKSGEKFQKQYVWTKDEKGQEVLQETAPIDIQLGMNDLQYLNKKQNTKLM